MKKRKQIWEKIINLGITPELPEKDTKYIRLTNGLAVIIGLWLLSTIPSLLFLLPSSKYLIFNSIFFPIVWQFVLYLNWKKKYTSAKLFFSYTKIICVTTNALQTGQASDNHLFLLLVSLVAFYAYPPNQIKYISLVSISSLLAFLGVEIYLSSHGPIIEAPLEFFQAARLISLTALCVLVFIMTYYNYNTLHKAQDLLEIEHHKSEKLLLNILPVSIANRLKKSNEIIADKTNEATILFADIVGFTTLSQKMQPEKLVSLLNELFSKFDQIVEEHKVEKIKTIGDAYMIVGGIPEPRLDHCEAIALCALAMQREMRKGISQEFKNFKIRIGIHSGPVVAGVIGKSKFIYDLWGDSVNTASRMESHGEEDKIQVTENVYSILKDKFTFEPKRTIQVKGKGEMNTYFLIGLKN